MLFPTILTDTPEARAKAWRDFERIMREALWYFTPAEVKGLFKKLVKRGKAGRKPEASINECVLEEYDAAVRDVASKRVNKAEFGRKFYEKYHKKYPLQSPEALVKQLDRLLKKRREAEAKKKG
jgi:hypothetical protein